MSVVMNMTRKLETLKMEFLLVQLLKTCQKIRLARSVALVRINSARHKITGNGGGMTSIVF